MFPAIRPAAQRYPYEVSVLHDFSPLLLPGTHLEQTRGEYREFFARTLLSSDLALAVSHSTKATPPGSRRWTRPAWSWPTTGRACACANMPTAVRFRDRSVWGWWSR